MNPTSLRPPDGDPPRPPARRSRTGIEATAKIRGEAVARRLAEGYPDSRCSLEFRSPFELLVATILSAQCTDRRVNMVTGELFRRWPTPAALAEAEGVELEAVIHSTGFFRAKARNILGCCRGLVERHGGQVPATLAELVRLPGVGRKTANVVLGVGFGRAEGVVVDTHVGRICRRLDLTRHSDAVRAERDLVRVVPADHWITFSHRLIDHGRAICRARRPRCTECLLADLCPRRGLPAENTPPERQDS
ncbi:MAG: endonuclease III [Planctomycetota bacterium]|nr:MAG: endonuclease III [Planctomycetota bacterium]